MDNAGVIQVFGARNLRMAQDLANIIGGVSAEQIMKLGKDEQSLLIEGAMTRCKQTRITAMLCLRSDLPSGWSILRSRRQ